MPRLLLLFITLTLSLGTAVTPACASMADANVLTVEESHMATDGSQFAALLEGMIEERVQAETLLHLTLESLRSELSQDVVAGEDPAVAERPAARPVAVMVKPMVVSLAEPARPAQAALAPPALAGFSKQKFTYEGDTLWFCTLPKDNRTHSSGPEVHETVLAEDASVQNEGLLDQETISFSGGMHPLPVDRLDLGHRPLPGTRHTMLRDVHVDAPEMNVTYKMTNNASARFSVNPQDTSSPLYTPVAREDAINSTGVYVELEVQDNLSFHLGGEMHMYANDPDDDHGDGTGAGATMGLRWNF